ncbi:MAG: hypothetical protein HUJ68_02215 [Clostridia bacterium]|nr:hypothetical protein [Clostridia bacterium]
MDITSKHTIAYPITAISEASMPNPPPVIQICSDGIDNEKIGCPYVCCGVEICKISVINIKFHKKCTKILLLIDLLS